MARKPRFNLPGVPQHVVQRGNNRESCFLADADNRRYLRDLHDAALKNQAAIHAYVLMTNHVHILVTPGHPYSITHMMQDLVLVVCLLHQRGRYSNNFDRIYNGNYQSLTYAIIHHPLFLGE